MHISKRLSIVALVAVLGALAFALAARGDEGNGHDTMAGSLRATLAPSQPTDPSFHGVPPGGASWSLAEGSTRLRSNGRFELQVEGLVLTALGNAGPITGIAASVFCGADATSTTPAAMTGVVPLSSDGDAEIETRLSLPSTCLVPVVLVQPVRGTALLNAYIAIEGFRP
jgi:hypothetical protein